MKFHLPKIKTKKTLKIVLPVLLVLIFSAAYFFIPKPQVAAASWWNDSWMYRRSIKITNNTSEQTNVYIIETIDTSATTSFQTDCGDLRFVTEQGELLDYYVVSDCWTDHTVIHTQFKTFPAGEQTIYYYYGNPSAPNGFSAADFATLASNYTVGAISSPETGGGPVSYWSFDDPSAGTGVTGGVHDESGQGYNGRNYNAMQKDKSECVVGSCLYFDGLDLTRIEADTKDNMQEFTVCTWFKANSLTNPDNENENWLISKNWVLSFFKSGKLRFWVPTNGGTYPQVLSSVNIEANKWYHVCAIYYGSGIADPKMYINGIDKSGQSYEGGNPQNDDSIIELYIGAGTQNPYAYNFQGYIDEVKIYPYARTADQIRQDYNAGLAGVKTSHGVLVAFGNSSDKWLTDGLIGYWKMDESATTTGAIDSSGHYATSTYYGNASTTAGKFGRGGVFNGIADSAVVVGVSQTLQPSNITFSAWIKRTKSWSEGYSEFFYAKKDDEWDSNGWYFQSNNVGADKCLEIMVDGGNGFYVTCTPDSTFPLNQWTHIAFTFNSSTNSYAAYINGTIQSVSASGNPDSISGTDDLKYITVGGNGLIDEVRIYNRALSASEVAKLYEWAPGPVLHLKMDEKTGNTAYDSSGNGNSGTITGATWARGKYGSALSFDGSDGNYVDLGTGSELALNRYTVSAWINVSSLVSEHAGRVVDRRTTGLNVNYILGVYMDGHADFGHSTDAPTWDYIQGTTDLRGKGWKYITGTYDGSNVRVYVDGVLENSKAASDPYTVGTQHAYIDYDFADLRGYFIGSIDDVRIYDYARTQKQILEDMSGKELNSSPGVELLYLKFDEGFGGTAYDSSIYKNNGILYPGTGGSNTATSSMWTNDGKFGKAIEFDGTDDYVEIQNSSIYNFSTSTNFSTSIWFKSSSQELRANSLLDKREPTGNYRGYHTWVSDRNTGVGFQLNDNNTNAFDHIGSGRGYNDGKWHNYILSVNFTNHLANVYVDGENIGKNIDISAVTGNITNSQLLLIGWNRQLFYFDGLIDEVKIYPYALTAEEAATDYNQGMAAVMGSTGKSTSAATSSNAALQEYCVPGSTDYCAGPVGEWKMDEKSGTTTYDTSGNGNDGTLTNGPTWTRGKIGSGLDFDGSNDYVSVPSMNYNSITVEAWFYRTQQDINNTYADAIWGGWKWDADVQNYEGYDLRFWGGEPTQISWELTTTNGSTKTFHEPKYDLGSNQFNNWYHAVGTYDSSTGVQNLYVGGILRTTANHPAGNTIVPLSTYPDMKIGYSIVNTGYFDGKIDDVRIYNYARTPAQIAWDYNRGKPVGYWKFDECQGGTIHDDSGNGNNGTLYLGTSGVTATGTCATTTSSFWYNGRTGKINSAGSFDGSDDYVLANGVNMNYVTISAWIKPDTFGENKYGRIVVKQDLNNESWAFYINDDDDNLKFSATYSPQFGRWYTPANTISRSIWQHVAVTYDYTTASNDPIFYINGVEQTTAEEYAASGSPSDEGDNFYIGNNYDNDRTFNGLIDEVKIFNYVLTAEQIKTEYTNGAVRFQ